MGADAPAVVHVTALHGGGVDRHVRSVARSVARPHWFWHAGASADVLENPADSRTYVLDRSRLAKASDALRARRVGVIHLHSTARPSRAIAARLALDLAARTIVTLHDVLFLRADAFEEGDPLQPDPAWLAEMEPVLRDAAAVLAPSDFIAGLAREHFPGLEVSVVPNGSIHAGPRALAPRAEFAARRPKHVVAVTGAIGPHKGSDILEELPAHLEGSDIGIVVVGYLDRQLFPGWRVPGRLFIHGAWADADATGLLEAYGARLVLFPNRVPESFSYALSDAWAAGLPVLATRQGALAERIERHGGGWLLPADADAATIARELRRLFEGDEIARVQSTLSRQDPARLPPLEDMARSLEALYRRFAIDPAAPADADARDLEHLVTANLDGSLFRTELIRLSDEYAQLAAALEDERGRFAQFQSEAREWIAKLEADVKTLSASLEIEVEERRCLGQEIVQLQIHKDAFDRLPDLVRRYLLKKTLDARN
ncbi:glycosyltransferase family 4 protein [Usitatibacter palustris]|uniref:Glycosyltransferase subfamily 4-like N-terminal domain-containing protein n=1 Tax=Usitatibacter palustris TaxID=2732487 RepID=A0A6M4H3F2_9PROT|nr:glycosyltransferase family 4 protein [Usitatibacter palustris]QJR14131.1 hypothetical protein DSM104440_00924 [Usitatibacter palustris]